jgi:hypothetical protein
MLTNAGRPAAPMRARLPLIRPSREGLACSFAAAARNHAADIHQSLTASEADTSFVR